jgi:hypothetical protein
MPNRNFRKMVVLQVASLALFCALTPAVAQGDGTTTSTTTAQSNSGSVVENSEYIPNGEAPTMRKDAWSWYWDEKAHIETNNSTGFWGDDAISNLFKNVCNSVLVPMWNGAMEYDFVRAGVLLIVAGMLLGLGAKIVLPKKTENK